MIYTMDEVEKMVPSAEKKEEEEEEEIKEEEEGGDDGDDGNEEDGGDEEQDGGDDKEKEEEATPHSASEKEKNIPLPVQPEEKKQDKGLNLNNEVVKMRKEVKRVRTLIIRKMTRQIGALKKKKGKEGEIERNQRRAARLLEELHTMKVLSPDLVTKTALQKNLNFEQECKDPKSTISSRAIARIATHPQFSKKIEGIKAAVKAFKEERMKDGKQGGKGKVQNKAEKVTLQLADKNGERNSETKDGEIAAEGKGDVDYEEGEGILGDTEEATVAESEKETGKATHSADTADVQRKEMQECKSIRPASIKSSQVKDIAKDKSHSEDAEQLASLKSARERPQRQTDEGESDVETSEDEEREYFDDSTEERFHKQSSQSEESEDDFFVGKVSKFKKKKQKGVEGEKDRKGHEVKGDPADPVQSKLDELESRLKSKPLQSVFCSSLSKSGRGRGADRGRGGDKFRGQGKPRGGGGLNRDFNKQFKFQQQEKGTERKSGSKYSKPESSERDLPSGGRGRGRGRGDGRVGGGVFSYQAPQQALHPSWEASKKRKEQQGQILAFQGKKIKFDDDD